MSKRLLSLLTIFVVVLSTIAVLNTPMAHAVQSGKYFDNIVVIIMENEGICSIMGSVVGCTPNLAPYEISLAQSWALGTHYTSVNNSTSNSFSLKNYLVLLSGQTWGCTSEVQPNDTSSPCSMNAWTSANSNLVDRLPSAITWKAYMENMTRNCQLTRSATYVADHDPFVYFNDIVGNPTRCGQVVPAGTSGSLDNTLLSDLNSASAPNMMWLTPNLCDDMHDICTGSNNQTSTGKTCGPDLSNQTICVPQGDKSLKHLVPSILSSYNFTHNRAALFITYDEGNGYCPNTSSSRDDCVYAVWAGLDPWQRLTTLLRQLTSPAIIPGLQRSKTTRDSEDHALPMNVHLHQSCRNSSFQPSSCRPVHHRSRFCALSLVAIQGIL